MAYEQEHALINGASNDTTSTQDTLGVGWTIASLASSGDVDYFKINATSAGLIKLDLSNELVTSTNHWNIALLNSAGDYINTLSTSVSGTPVVDTFVATSPRALTISGLTSSTIAAGTRFTIKTSSADTVIYTVVSQAAVTSGLATVTVDADLPSTLTAATGLSFDPAQGLADGGVTSLTAYVAAAGTYFLKVKAASWSDAEYQVRASVLPTIESSGDNGTKEAAVSDNNRLLAGAAMTGALSSSTDTDSWVFTTASASDFSIDFAAASGSDATAQWKVNVTKWDGEKLQTVSGTDISSLTAGKTASFAVDDARYNGAATFVVTVSPVSSTVFNTGAYTLKVSGAALDLNDAPVITIDTVNSSTPGILVDTGVVRSIKAGADSKVALSTLFSVSDPDAGQTISSYKLALAQTSGGTVAGSIKLIEADGTTVSATYGMNTSITLTAAQMAKAYLFAGTDTGDLSLTIQAFDSSNAPDDSGASSLMRQTVRVASAATDVVTSNDGALALIEETSDSAELLNFSLATQPTADVKIYLEDLQNQFDFDKSVLTFTSENWAAVQTVTVKASTDSTTEGTASSVVSFRVVSAADVNYDGFAIAPLSIAISDPPNRLPTGGVTIDGTATEDLILTANTAALVDLDGLGTLTYQWQRSTNGGSSWANIGNASASAYTLGNSDVGNLVRVQVTYVDQRGTTETVNSAATAAVANVNDAPTTASVTVTTSEDTAYTFLTSNFAFTDVDPGDSLKAVEIQELPTKGSIKYDGVAVALTGGVYTVTAADIAAGKLTYHPAANGNGSAYTTFAFKVQDQSDAKSAAGAVTVNVTAVNDSPTGAVAITGTVAVGETLAAGSTLADPDGLGALAYQWQASADGGTWTNIAGAASATYALTSSELGQQVRVRVSYTDGGGTSESVVTVAASAVLPQTISGTSGDDALTGDDFANTLNGGAGADTMTGLGGNDNYIVDNAGDTVVEIAGGGTDAVYASITYALGSNVENLFLTGSADLNGLGNELDNAIAGNSGNNVLYGGLGADAMAGGAGNDVYVVDNAGDTVTESSTLSSEIDSVLSSVSFTLGANVENLTLSGFGNLNATGNDAANAVVGNAGNNVIDGKAGNDVLYGGIGNDIFTFSTALNASSNVDTIMDFAAGDRIGLDGAIFTALTGSISAGELVASDTVTAASATGSAHLLYNTSTGAVYYDADGAGGADAVQFAVVGQFGVATSHPILTAADFLLV